MNRNTKGTTTIRSSSETREWFLETFEASGFNSQGEFLEKLLARWNSDEPKKEATIETVQVEKQLNTNEILIGLTPAQLFALRGTVLSTPNFAETQNDIIESLKKRPFLNFNDIFDPAFQGLWVRNIVVTKTMSQEERENAIRHNMGAFLINMFLIHIIEGSISVTKINASNLKEFIKNQVKPGKASNETPSNKQDEQSISKPDTTTRVQESV